MDTQPEKGNADEPQAPGSQEPPGLHRVLGTRLVDHVRAREDPERDA